MREGGRREEGGREGGREEGEIKGGGGGREGGRREGGREEGGIKGERGGGREGRRLQTVTSNHEARFPTSTSSPLGSLSISQKKLSPGLSSVLRLPFNTTSELGNFNTTSLPALAVGG